MRNWVWFWLQLENEYANQKGLLKRLLSSPQYQENPKIPEPRSHEHDYTCIFHKSYRIVQQFDKWTTRWSHQETPACAKHSCQTTFQSKEIWLHTCCTGCASLASSEIPDWFQNAVDHLQRTSWQGILYEACVLNVPKWKHDTFPQTCFRSLWTSGLE